MENEENNYVGRQKRFFNMSFLGTTEFIGIGRNLLKYRFFFFRPYSNVKFAYKEHNYKKEYYTLDLA